MCAVGGPAITPACLYPTPPSCPPVQAHPMYICEPQRLQSQVTTPPSCDTEHRMEPRAQHREGPGDNPSTRGQPQHEAAPQQPPAAQTAWLQTGPRVATSWARAAAGICQGVTVIEQLSVTLRGVFQALPAARSAGSWLCSKMGWRAAACSQSHTAAPHRAAVWLRWWQQGRTEESC